MATGRRAHGILQNRLPRNRQIFRKNGRWGKNQEINRKRHPPDDRRSPRKLCNRMLWRWNRLFKKLRLWIGKKKFCAKPCGHLMWTFCIEDDECLKCHTKIDSKCAILSELWFIIFLFCYRLVLRASLVLVEIFFGRTFVISSVSDLIRLIWTYLGHFWRFRSYFCNFGLFLVETDVIPQI